MKQSMHSFPTIMRHVWLGALCACSLLTHAAGLGPDLAQISNTGFGWAAMSGGNPAVGSLSEFASNMLNVIPARDHTGVEYFLNTFSYSDLRVTTNQDTVLQKVGPGAVRISYFRYDSNTAHDVNFVRQVSQALPGQPVVGGTVNGEALELSYAQPVGRRGTTLGVSVTPIDTSNVQLTTPAFGSLTNGQSWTTGGGRVGVLQPLPYRLRFGADYSYQASGAKATFLALTPQGAATVTEAARYLTRKTDLGLAHQTTPRLLTFIGYSQTLTSGGTLGDFKGDSISYGLSYDVTPVVSTKLTSTGNSNTASLSWITPYGEFTLAYSYRPLTNATSYLGDNGSALAGMVDVAF